MSLSDATRQRIENYLAEDRVVLFMKGTPDQPMCGFSARTVAVLKSLLPSFSSFNVLEDEEIREGIKVYGNWPTIPQLYVDGELVGGCDIVTAMFNSGELHETFGLEPPDRSPPEITITDEAAEKIRAAMGDHAGVGLHFHVDGDWQSQFTLGPVEGHEIRAESNGIELYMDVGSAERARGAKIEWVETLQGEGLSIHLPEAPAPVTQMPPAEAKARLDAGELMLVDVRGEEERAKASIDGAVPLDQDFLRRMEDLPKDTAIAFVCHTGNRSQGAAEHFRKEGFTNVANVSGGINAWSLEADPSVPQY
ncbi:MAG: Grx4 family monothiol glutaredoxin [Xanthomonadales bacterium]|nr:Grx4 family monothiol glutaredoxin [Xanthomonadales bacterium]